MQDETTPPQTTPSIQNVPIAALSPKHALDGMATGAETPLDFIKRSLGEQATSPDQNLASKAKAVFNKVTTDYQAEQKPAATEPVVSTVDVTKQELTFDGEANEKPKESSVPENGQEAASGSVSEEDELADVPDSPAAENFKKLRTKVKETSKTLKEIQTQKQALEKELEDFKTGKVVAPVLKEKEQEIERLSQYEKLHNLKASPYYQEKYVKPLSAAKEKLVSTFKDYNIPPEKVQEALAIDNQADLNQFLSDHFDPVGAIEVKQAINETKRLDSEAKAAENEPVKALTQIESEGKAAFEMRENQRKQKIYTNAKSSWEDAVSSIRQENKVLELIPRESDPKFNKEIVAPIYQQAASDYQAFVQQMAKAGLPELPSELGKVLAKSFLLSCAAGLAISTRNQAVTDIQNFEKNNSRLTAILRPNVGGGSPSAARGLAAPAAIPSPQAEASAILNKVLAGK